MNGKKIKEIPLDFIVIEENEMKSRAKSFNELLQKRRTVRNFSNKPVPRNLIEQCLLAANSAPSGANRQPWHFAVISSPEKKRQIREGAEEEEREFYQSRAPQDWLDALAPLGTDANKPFLERAPYLVAIFGQKFELDSQGKKKKNYYVAESVGIATGLLIAALHNAGLATLTHTPSPMKFLNRILDRPDTEKPLMVLVVGYPENDAKVPAISRKSLEQFTSFHEG
ncbi:MAG: nitroreductase family protein [Gammaproteobacteria bacterium]|jgi:iodotyrosine deiodinase|nr:nitroreductase family protein [Gammaproteobacteria bacterium]